jgi:hypothetical protein
MINPTKDIAARQLESGFSLPPTALGYCGQSTAARKFTKCIISGECSGVDKEIANFIVLYPYLKILSKIFHLPILSYPVVEAYWIGNKYLRKVKSSHYNLLLEKFLKQGIPSWLVKDLRAKKPKKFIPTHLWQVLYVGVGRASGAVPFNLGSVNSCMIRWGKIEAISHGKVVAHLNSLQKRKNQYTLTLLKENAGVNSILAPRLKIGDTVAVHWNQVVKVLTVAEEKNLNFWTRAVIKSLD